MTYRLEMQGAAKRLERDRQALMAAVWHIAALPRMRPLPSFSDFTGIKAVVRKQTPEEVRERFSQIREDAARAA